MSETLREHVGGHLSVELNEDSRLRSIFLVAVRSVHDFALVFNLLVRFTNLFASPVDSVDLLADETEETKLVSRTFLRRNPTSDFSTIRFRVESGSLLLLLFVLGDSFRRKS